MALNEIRTWLIAYDITCPKRLGRVHHYLKKIAIPVQYSIFIAEESGHRIRRIHDELAQLIDPKTDDVRIYPLPVDFLAERVGSCKLPEGLRILTESNRSTCGILVNHLSEAKSK